MSCRVAVPVEAGLCLIGIGVVVLVDAGLGLIGIGVPLAPVVVVLAVLDWIATDSLGKVGIVTALLFIRLGISPVFLLIRFA
jgi:hypothetical protein